MRVRGVERARDLLEDRDRAIELEPPRADQLLEVAAADVAHRDVDDAAGLSRVVDRDDPGMVERCDHLRLPDEAFAEVPVGGELGQERLDRGLATEDRVLGLEDVAHPAPAKHAREAVAGDHAANAQGLAHRSALRRGRASPRLIKLRSSRK